MKETIIEKKIPQYGRKKIRANPAIARNALYFILVNVFIDLSSLCQTIVLGYMEYDGNHRNLYKKW